MASADCHSLAWPDCHLTLVGVTPPGMVPIPKGLQELAIGGGEVVPNKPFTWQWGIHSYLQQTYKTAMTPTTREREARYGEMFWRLQQRLFSYEKTRVVEGDVQSVPWHEGLECKLGHEPRLRRSNKCSVCPVNADLEIDRAVAALISENVIQSSTQCPYLAYQNGIDWHTDLEASRFLYKRCFVAAVGYYFNQLTGDTGAGATLNPYLTRIAAVGPEMGVLFPVGEMQGSLSLSGYWEFALKTGRPAGIRGWRFQSHRHERKHRRSSNDWQRAAPRRFCCEVTG